MSLTPATPPHPNVHPRPPTRTLLAGGGYYLAKPPPRSPNASKFLIFLEGGGWCLTQRGTPPSGAGGCAARAWAAPGLPNGMLGSTRRAPLSIDPHGSGGAGDLSANASLNPVFRGWTSVELDYCDGGSYAGSRDGPATIETAGGKTEPVWYRGKHILRAVLEELKDLHGLGEATEVVLGGCSAGGLGVYLVCDAVAEYLGPSIKTRCFADAGFFPDVKSVSGQSIAAAQFRNAFEFMNASGGVDQSCLAAQPVRIGQTRDAH